MLDCPGLPAPAIEIEQLHKRGRYEKLSIKCKSTNTLAEQLRTDKETRHQSKENGGEPLIDPLFEQTHAYAWDLGMLIQISSNGSRLDQPRTLDILTTRRPSGSRSASTARPKPPTTR